MVSQSGGPLIDRDLLCNTAEVEIKYENFDMNFEIEFSRIDRNKSLKLPIVKMGFVP